MIKIRGDKVWHNLLTWYESNTFFCEFGLNSCRAA